MNPNEFGRRLGIGLRVAGRIAQDRVQDHSQTQQPDTSTPNPAGNHARTSNRPLTPREKREKTHSITRAAGRGVGGFLRPFGRVGGILWLEVTGFFFGLFALFFAQDLWRTRLSYATGPQHQRFLIAAALVAVFGYLCVTAFWRARRR